MVDYKLQNVLLDPGDFAESCPGLFWHVVEGTAAYDAEAGALRVNGVVDFTTYLNGLSIKKWQRYTCVRDASVALTVSGGRCTVRVTSLVQGKKSREDSYGHGRKNLHVGELVVSDAAPLVLMGEGKITAQMPLVGAGDAEIVGFRIETAGEALVHTAHYLAAVNSRDIRNVRLAIATTTFKKEHYITRNIELVRDNLLSGEDSLGDSFHMFVVDNGRTLDAEALSGGGVSVLPNPNVGGSGGFARGMMEAEDWDATHVILMDDDVRVLPESMRRTFALLSLRTSAYEDAFLSGAMLNLENPNEFFEDVSFVRRDGIYLKIKPNFYVDDPIEALDCEAMEVERPRAYAAWWYCCIPISAVRKNGLPLPLFVRCDDVEYGERCEPTIMSMNGICVWHEQFEGRFRPSVDCYQYYRNFLVMDAMCELGVRKVTMARFNRTFHIFLRVMAYETCELMLDGIEDFLKGPQFFEEANGEAIMKEKGAKNEKLVPIEELSAEDQALVAQAQPDFSYFGGDRNRHVPMKLLEQLPHDRHLLPDVLLSDKPGWVYYPRGGYPARETMGRKVLVAYDYKGTAAHVRRIDRERWQELTDRHKRLVAEMATRGEQVAQEYRAAKGRLTSRAFWKTYLADRM